MKKLLALILATMLLFVACDPNIGGDVPSTPGSPDTPVGPGPDDPSGGNNPIELINHGDFEVYDGSLGGSWGVSNGSVIEEAGNKYVSIDAADSYEELYYNNFYPFFGSDAVLSARIKLGNAEDASKVSLQFVVKSDSDEDLKVFSVNPDATTEWQKVELEIPATQYDGYVYVTNPKVTADNVESIYVDDVSLMVADETKINWIPFGDFEYAASKANAVQEYWKVIRSGAWENVSIKGDSDKYVELETNCILIGRAQVISGDQNNPDYPINNIDYPNQKNGLVTIRVQGDAGTIIVYEFKAKNPGAEEDGRFSGQVVLEDDSVTELTIDFPAVSAEQNETEIQIKNEGNNGSFKIYDIRLNLV